MWFLTIWDWRCARQIQYRGAVWVDPSFARPQLPENVVMQLELFCAEETVRGYEQRLTAHVEHERITRLLATPRCQSQTRRRAVTRIPPISLIDAVARGIHFLWCTAMPRRRSSCTALS